MKNTLEDKLDADEPKTIVSGITSKAIIAIKKLKM